MSPLRIRCPSCATPSAAIAVEYGHPDEDLFARAERGEVAIGGDVLFGGEPDWRCTACGHGFAGVTTDGGLRVVDPDDLEPAGYAASTRLLSERLELTRAACEAVVESPDPGDGAGAAVADLLAWIGARYPLALPVFGLGAGLDRILVPSDLRPLGDQLDAATEVCRAVVELWSARPATAVGAREVLDAAVEAYVDVRDGRPTGDEMSDDDLFEALLDLAERATEPDDGWDEVRELAGRAFDVWVGGSEQAWARYAWGVLRRTGHTAFATHVDRARVIVRLLALSVLHQEFCVRAFDEGQPGGWTLADPGIDPFVIGMPAGRDGVGVDIEIDHEVDAGRALRELVLAEYDTVTGTLHRELGQTVLFASLWASSGDDVRYPLPSEVVGGIVNTDIGDKMPAWEWMDGGMGPVT